MRGEDDQSECGEPVSQGKTHASSGRKQRAYTGYHFGGDLLRFERRNLFGRATIEHGITTFQPDNALSHSSRCDESLIDLLLRGGLIAAPFTPQRRFLHPDGRYPE